MEDRLEKIESKLSLAEDMLDELNKTVYRQQGEIEQLQRAVVTLREQVRAAQPNEPRNLHDEIPPHY
jgi:SlyX protein